MNKLIFFSLFFESTNFELSPSFFVNHDANFEGMFLSTEHIGHSMTI